MASSSCLVNSTAELDRDRVIEELTRGRDIAAHLRLALRQTHLLDPALRTLVAKILDSFTQSIAVLCPAHANSGVVPQAPPPKSECSGDSSCKTPKDRRGCHKRKRSAETWTKEGATWPEDGYAWRKYGQKVILNAKHPRNYFRCTHKYDQGCPATKQVQIIQDDPLLYRAIYHAHHSCTAAASSLSSATSSSSSLGQIMMDMGPRDSAAVIWSFQQQQQQSRPIPIKQETQLESSSDPPSAGCVREYECLISDQHQLAAFSSDNNNGDVISSSDVYSCTTSTPSHSMEMGMEMDMTATMGSVVLDDFLNI